MQDILFATFTATTGAQAGILALSGTDGSEIWWDDTISHRIYTQRPTLDADRGLVYTTDESAYCNPDEEDFLLLAYAATSSGATTPEYFVVIDGILNGPPTFGQVMHQSDNDEDPILCDAVFVVTNPFNGGGGASIYAFKRDDLTPLWKTEYPEACWTGSTYSNGRLYVLGNEGDFVSVFDANTGAPVYEEFIPTDWQADFLSIADVRDQDGNPHSVIYHHQRKRGRH
jgi:outer membrane protein assembly factor BamB